MICQKCGMPNDTGNSFCNNCGTPLVVAAPINNPLQQRPPQQPQFIQQPTRQQQPVSQPNIVQSTINSSIANIKQSIEYEKTHGADIYERNLLIAPECIALNEGEIPVRQYDAAILRNLLSFERAEGRLLVTNLRLIFRATGRTLPFMQRTITQFEFALDDISGIEVRNDYAVSWTRLFVLILLLISLPIFLLVSFFSANNAFDYLDSNYGNYYEKTNDFSEVLFIILGFGLIVLGVFLIIKKLPAVLAVLCSIGSMNFFTQTEVSLLVVISVLFMLLAIYNWLVIPNLVIVIQSKGGLPAVNIRRKKLFSKEESTGFNEIYPSKDVDRMVRELGAMINDIQKLGNIGVEKWIVNETRPYWVKLQGK
jgi:hypothetical protein